MPSLGRLTALNVRKNKKKSPLDRLIGKIFPLGLALFPSFCKLCGSFLSNRDERIVCAKCLEELKPHTRSYCRLCGRFFQHDGEPFLCENCLVLPPAFTVHRSCGLYYGRLREIILLFKYRKYRILERPLFAFMQSSLYSYAELWQGLDMMIPVPLHKKRQRERGFNQALVLGRHLSSWRGCPLESKVLQRKVFRPPQTSLNAEDRGRNIRGVFSVKNQKKIQGKTVLLVDDVYTTGATLNECSRTLLKFGAREVRAVTIARAD